MSFSMLDFIDVKKNGGEHSQESIEEFITLLCEDDIPDYQISAWLMAVRLVGMTEQEISWLTDSMARSGEMIDLSYLPNTADKHSTGGVGDKTTLIVAPIAAALGVNVVKFSGRALDFTGGTLDKLESIPGFKTSMTIYEIAKQAKQIGLVLAGSSENMVPADKILYALRDVTSTVDSIPLIAASVMSKKIAGGAESIVLDVKYGDGAFMTDPDDAETLARLMISIGTNLGRKTSAIISSMDSPLGIAVGNSLEIIESLEVLKGKGSNDIKELCFEVVSRMVSLAFDEPDIDLIKTEIQKRIDDRSALERFRQMVELQGGDVRIIDDYAYLPFSKFRFSYLSEQDGYITHIATKKIGNLVRKLGGGRYKKEDVIDPTVGLRFFLKAGDPVRKDNRIVDVYYNDEHLREMIMDSLNDAINIGPEQVETPPLIYKII